jgi:hypothetical protein
MRGKFLSLLYLFPSPFRTLSQPQPFVIDHNTLPRPRLVGNEPIRVVYRGGTGTR